MRELSAGPSYLLIRGSHWEMRVPYSIHIVCPSVLLSVHPSTLSLCCDNLNTFQPRTFKLCIWVIYQIMRTPIVFGVITSKVKVTGNFFGFLTFLSLMLHCAAITGILFCRELSNLVRMFIWVRSWWSSNMGHLGLSVRPSVCLSTLSMWCDNWNTFLQRTFKLLQNVSLDKILVNFEYCSSGVCLSVCPSVHLSTFSLCYYNWNTFLQKTFKLCLWVIYQIRGTPIVFESHNVKGQGYRQLLCFFCVFFFFIPFSNAKFFGFFFLHSFL